MVTDAERYAYIYVYIITTSLRNIPGSTQACIQLASYIKIISVAHYFLLLFFQVCVLLFQPAHSESELCVLHHHIPLFQRVLPRLVRESRTSIHPPIHVHTHIHTPFHPCTHAHTHPHMHPSTHPHMYTCTHPSTHAPIHTSTHVHMHTPIHTCTHPHIHTCTQSFIHPYTYTPVYPYTHTHTYTPVPTHTGEVPCRGGGSKGGRSQRWGGPCP